MANKLNSTKQNKHRNINFRKVITAAILIVAVIVSALFTYGCGTGMPSWDDVYRTVGLSSAASDEVYDNPLTVSFLDVGQGDSCIIHSDDFTMLIDSGVRYNESVIQEELDKLGVRKLDYVVCTHPHADHIGSMPEIFQMYTVGTVIMPYFNPADLEEPTIYNKTLKQIRINGCDKIRVEPGVTFDEGEAHFTILGPVHRTSDCNNASVVLKLTYGNVSFLFTGDAEAIEESEILSLGMDLKADVLKVGHHGSDSSSTNAFIRAVNPSVGVISCGANNDYGHPHRETMDVLNRHNVEILRTDTSGTIVIGTDGEKLAYSSNIK